jgi:hypothetical protein
MSGAHVLFTERASNSIAQVQRSVHGGLPAQYSAVDGQGEDSLGSEGMEWSVGGAFPRSEFAGDNGRTGRGPAGSRGAVSRRRRGLIFWFFE